jgi:hypothetical protein
MHPKLWNAIIGASLAIAVATAGAAPATSESPEALEGPKPSAAGPLGSSHAEPVQRPDAEHAALLAAYRGEPFSDPPASPALAAAMERVRNTPAPESELFALVTVTDRRTGERRVLTRGTPDPDYAGWVTDPDTAPANRIYWESEDASADAQVEVVVRAIHMRIGRHKRSQPDKDEEDCVGAQPRPAARAAPRGTSEDEKISSMVTSLGSTTKICHSLRSGTIRSR